MGDITKGDKLDKNIKNNETERNIQDENSLTYSYNYKNNPEYTGRLKPSYLNDRRYYDYTAEAEAVRREDVNTGHLYNPQEKGDIGWLHTDYGKSYYDEYASTVSDLQDLNEVRAREQGIIPTLGSGLGRFTVETLNTAVGNIIGTVVGIGQGIDNLDDPNSSFFQGIWKNSVTEAQDYIRKFTEDLMPIYTSKKEQQMGVLRSMITDNFWANMMSSAGFTAGMLLSTYLTGGMGVGSAAANLLKAAGASGKASNFAYRLVSGIMGSVSESSMEALNNYNETKEHYINEINNTYQLQRDELNKRMNAEIMSELIKNNRSLLSENPIRIPEQEEAIKQQIQAKYNDLFAKLDQKYQNDINSVENRALSAGTMTFGLNMAILGTSNTMGTLSFLKAPSQNAERQIAKGFGQRLKEFFKPNDPTKPFGDGISRLEAKAIGIREGLAEGFEESNQKWASNLAAAYYGSDYDPNATDSYSRFIEKSLDTFKTTYTDPETWKEWTMGALTGLLGTFNPGGIAKDASGQKTSLSDYWQGGVIESFREGNKLAERSQKAYNEMNKFATDENLKRNIRLGIFNVASKQRQMEAAARGDKFAYENENDAQAIKMAQTFADAGKLNEFEGLIGVNDNISDEELDALCDGLVQSDKNGKFISDYSYLLTENGEKISSIIDKDDPRRKKAKEKIAKESQRIHNIIRNYQKKLNEADAQTGYQRSPEELGLIAWGLTQVDNWKEREKSMYKKDEFKNVIQSIREDVANRLKRAEDDSAISIEEDEDYKRESENLKKLNDELNNLKAINNPDKDTQLKIKSTKSAIAATNIRLRRIKDKKSNTTEKKDDNKDNLKKFLEELDKLDEIYTTDDIFELQNELASENGIRVMVGRSSAFDDLISMIKESKISDDKKQFAIGLVTDMKKCSNAAANLNNYIKSLIKDPSRIQTVIDESNKANNSIVIQNEKTKIEQFAEDIKRREDIDIPKGSDVNESALSEINFRILSNAEKNSSFDKLLKESIERLETNLRFNGWDKNKIDKYINKVLNKIIENVSKDNKEFGAFSEAYKLNKMLSNLLDDVISSVENSGTFIEEEARDLTQKLFETLNIYAYSHNVHPIFLNRTDVLNILKHLGYDIDKPEIMASLIFVDKIYKRLRGYLSTIKANGSIKLQTNNNGVFVDDTSNNKSYFVEGSEFNESNANTKQGVVSATKNAKMNLDAVYSKIENQIFETLEEKIESEAAEWGIDPIVKNPPNNNITPTGNTVPTTTPNTPATPSILGTGTINNNVNNNSNIIPLSGANKNFKSIISPLAKQKMENEGGYDFVNSGKLHKFVESKKGRVPIFAMRDSNVNDKNIIFFYVQLDDGKYQLIGFLQEDEYVSYLKSYLFGTVPTGYEPQSGKSTDVDGNVHYTNIIPTITFNDIPFESDGITPIPIFNKNGEQLSIQKNSNITGSFDIEEKEDLAFNKHYGKKTAETAADDGDIFVSLWGRIVPTKNPEKDSKNIPKTGSYIMTTNARGELFPLRTTPAPITSLIENISNENDSVIKAFKEYVRSVFTNKIFENLIYDKGVSKMPEENLNNIKEAFKELFGRWFYYGGLKRSFINNIDKNSIDFIEVEYLDENTEDERLIFRIVQPKNDSNELETIFEITVSTKFNSVDNIENDFIDRIISGIQTSKHNEKLAFSPDYRNANKYKTSDILKYMTLKTKSLMAEDTSVLISYQKEDGGFIVNTRTVNKGVSNGKSDTETKTKEDVVKEDDEEIPEEAEETEEGFNTGENPVSSLEGEDDIPFREIEDTNPNIDVFIKSGVYSGYMLARDLVKKAANKFSLPDKRLIDFILNNINDKLVIKVLNADHWESFSKDKGFPEGVLGVYSPKSTIDGSDIIVIKEGSDITTFVHELAHAATINLINKNIKSENSEAISGLRDVLNTLRNLHKENPSIFKDIEGANNFLNQENIVKALKELVAECIANKDLQKIMKGIDSKKAKEQKPKSLLSRFIDWLKGFIKRLDISKEVADKLLRCTLYDEFEASVLSLKYEQPKLDEQKVDNNQTSGKYRAYTNTNLDKDTNIIQYSTNNIDNVNYDTVETTGFLRKYDKNGDWSSEFIYLNKAFTVETGNVYNIDDTTEFGNKIKRQFYEYLIKKGYKGLDTTTNNKAFGKISKDNDAYLIQFGSNYRTKEELEKEFNVNLDNATEGLIDYYRNCK